MTDPLLAWRAEFPILDTCTYLVSHSLGAMPRKTAVYLQQFADEWSRRGVHPSSGVITVLELATNVGLHDLNHIAQMTVALGS